MSRKHKTTPTARKMAGIERPQCPHGEKCPCAIATRHEWFAAFSDERYREMAATELLVEVANHQRIISGFIIRAVAKGAKNRREVERQLSKESRPIRRSPRGKTKGRKR